MIESVSSWLTPTVFFCVLNLVIATILITSTLRNNDKKQQLEGEDQLPRTPSLLQRVRSVNLSFADPFSSPLTSHHYPDNSSPSLLQRVRSINFSFSSQKLSPFPSLEEQPAAYSDEEDEQEEDLKCHVTRSKSATCGETTTMKKEEVVVVQRQPWTAEEKKLGGVTTSFGDEEEEAVDRKANDFINKFREQLKMQRIHSILKYKEMSNRGVSI
ncbi:unnamed protein product [Withania somnifera]